MSKRLDQEREKELEPERVKSTKEKLEGMGYNVEVYGGKMIQFSHKGHTVKFWPYSGWHSGKTIEDGRGFKKLQKKLLG